MAGEGYLHGQLSWMPVTHADYGLDAGALTVGGGYFLGDFCLLEAGLTYGATGHDSEFHQLASAELAFRLLVDATEWIPSIGPVAGWLFHHAPTPGLEGGFFVGASACLDRRASRTWSVGACGEYSMFPLGGPLEGAYFLGLRAALYLPAVWE
jgi:hypothetical protein